MVIKWFMNILLNFGDGTRITEYTIGQSLINSIIAHPLFINTTNLRCLHAIPLKRYPLDILISRLDYAQVGSGQHLLSFRWSRHALGHQVHNADIRFG